MKIRIYRAYYPDDDRLENSIRFVTVNPELAAKRYYAIYPVEFESKITVDKDWVFKVTDRKIFSLSELFPEKIFKDRVGINLEQKDFDFNRLDDFAKSVFLTIKRLFPEWLKGVKHSSEWWEERFDIEWTSPCKGVPEIWISTGGGDYYDLQIGFGGAHIHMAYNHSELKTIESWILKANSSSLVFFRVTVHLDSK